MSSLTDYNSAAAGEDTSDTISGFGDIPAVPSYLIGADNHQIGNTGTSILNPSTWGDRVDHGFKFSVSALTRATASAFNSVVSVGELVGVADETDRASTKDWLQGMDDDLAQYYTRNQSSVDTVGDVVGMFAPGMAGIKVFNWAQKGIALAAEGRAGLSLAAHFGTLASKQSQFAKLAAADMASSTSAYSMINANLAKSLGAGYLQNALEFAAFDTAAALTMGNTSPLFKDHDASDIAYNALLGGGMIGAGVMGTVTAAQTIFAVRAAGKAVDEATHAWRTVLTEPTKGTPANEALAIRLNNIEAIPTVAKDDPLYKLKMKGAAETRLDELDNGRLAAHDLAKSDTELGNTFFDTVSRGSSEDASNKLAGVVRISRAGWEVPELKALGDSGEVTYLKLHGTDAGKLYDAPATLRMSDKLPNEARVLEEVRSYKHKQGQDWNVVAASAETDAIESRYIAAQIGEFDPAIKIGAQDIPFLERAYQEMTKGTTQIITLRDGTTLDKSGLFHHLTDLKGVEANRLQEVSALQGLGIEGKAAAPFTTGDIAKFTNVKQSYLEGQMNHADPAADFFAIQSEAAAFTKKQIELGAWHETKGMIKTYLQPQYAKMVLDTSKVEAISGHEISGMVALKEQQRIYREQAITVSDKYLGEADAALVPKQIPGVLMTGADRQSVGGGLFTSQNAGYKTLGSFVQEIGKTTANMLQKKATQLADRFAPSGSKLLMEGSADGTEFWKVTQQLRQTPEKYELVSGRGLVNIKQLDYEAEIKAAATSGGDVSKIAKPVFEDTRAPVEIPLESAGMRQFAEDWNSYHREHLTHKTNLRNSQGLSTSDTIARTFYVPPVDGRQFPHFAFVVDDSITGTGHISTIHANSATELEALAAKVPTEGGLKVIYKDQSERWHRAMKDYDYDLGINENYIDSALKRSGVSASYFPRTDPKVLWEELMQWRKNQDSGLLRDMLEHRFSPEFAELRRQGAQYDLAANSRVGYVDKMFKAKQSNPYTDYIKTALYQGREDTTPIWSAVNRLAETGVASAVSKLQDTWKQVKTPADLELINRELKSIGCAVYEDAATFALANHTAPKPVLSNWIRQANSLLTFTMLRSDPLNALNNGFGHAVLYGTEMKGMIDDIFKTAGAQELRDMAHIKVPGTPTELLSPAKLAANAYSDWFKKVLGDADAGAMYQNFKTNNWIPSFTDQFKVMQDQLTLRGTETAAELESRMYKAVEAAKKFGDTAEKVTGNRFAEEMNRFVAAHTANAVADIAIKHGVLLPELKNSVINTFVNRTQGVMLAQQRPLLFKGAIGQAVGLFQTYQFNMLQQLFRYVGEGNKGRVGTLLGLQGSVYGMNGLPAFNAMNNYLVGNAAGNKEHSDVITATYDAAGKEAGDWLLYGVASNFLLHPDAKVNLYSRGDINPRQVTVIPTALADVPLIGATSKFFGSLYEATQKIDKGAAIWGSFLQGVEHSGISRPLAGFAQAMQATNNPRGAVFSTDNAGNISMQNDLFSLMTAARIMGAKPLDEAIATDAYHRVTVYDAANRKKMNLLGESIKVTVAAGNIPSPEEITKFAAEYAAAGGKQEQFNKFWVRQTLNANKSKVNSMIDNANTPGSRYMQKIMGGYSLSDFNNTSEEE